MAKYKEGKAGIMGHKNRTNRNTKPDSPVSLSQASTSSGGSLPTNDLRLHCGKIQKVGIIVSKIIIPRLTSQSGQHCLGYGGLRH
jgi:hypothetical protein